MIKVTKRRLTGMKFLTQLEHKVLRWFKGIPHLPTNVQKWLGDNVWWLTAIGAVLAGISVLGLLISILGNLSTLASPIVTYYASTTFVTWLIVKAVVALVFVALECVLLAAAVAPLKLKQKKGWVLLFAAWLVGAVSVVINSILTLSALSFMTYIIFGALWTAVFAYFLFEMHGQFAHVERSKGVKSKA